MVVQDQRDGNMDHAEANKAQRAAILRAAIRRLEEALLDAEGERREAIVKLITNAEVALARVDKQQLH